MERKYRVVSVGERHSPEEADELVRKLAELGVNSQIRVDEEISELLPLDEAQVAALGTVNFKEFSELMGRLGFDTGRAKQLWGNLSHWTDLVSRAENPFYEVDADAVLSQARPESRASRKYFERVLWWDQHLASTYLELAPVVEQIRSGQLIEEVGIGPVTVDSLTLLINLRASQIAEAQAAEPTK